MQETLSCLLWLFVCTCARMWTAVIWETFCAKNIHVHNFHAKKLLWFTKLNLLSIAWWNAFGSRIALHHSIRIRTWCPKIRKNGMCPVVRYPLALYAMHPGHEYCYILAKTYISFLLQCWVLLEVFVDPSIKPLRRLTVIIWCDWVLSNSIARNSSDGGESLGCLLTCLLLFFNNWNAAWLPFV